MNGCLLLIAMAHAREEVEVIAGGRTAPEATVEVPEPKNDLEPAGLVAVIGRIETLPDEGFWARAEGALWLLTEDDARLAELRPALGWGARKRHVGGELAATWQGQWLPWNLEASSGRTEALADGNVRAGEHRFDLSVVAIDRRYPWHTEWGFSTVQPGVGWRWEHGVVRGGLGAAYQVNEGWTIAANGGLDRSTGNQIRGEAEVGIATRQVDLWFRYSPIAAFEGDYAEAAQPQFTPIGEYADDADALSAGGFFQHRLDASLTYEAKGWTVQTEGLARIRTSQPGDLAASFARTLHGQVSVEHALDGSVEKEKEWTWVGVLGVSAAELVDGRHYADVYGWVGARWRPDATR